MGLFRKGQEKSPKDLVQEWTHKIRKEGYNLDRQIRSIGREEEKAKRALKESAKKGEKDACKILAKEIVNSRKVVNKLYASKAHLNSIQMGMKNQLSTLRIAGALQQSTDVMQSMQALVKVPEIQATMRDLSKEMMKAGIIEEMLEDTMEGLEDQEELEEEAQTEAGIIEEMLEDTMEGLEDQEELEEEAQTEVDKVLWELTAGQLGEAPAAVADSLPPTAEREPARAAALDDKEEDEEELMGRLEALRS